MKRFLPFLFLILFCCLCPDAGAQQVLRGCITDAQQQVPEMIQVALQDSTHNLGSLFADSAGCFALPLLPGGRQLLITAPGYEPKTLLLKDTLPVGGFGRVSLDAAKHMLKGVEVIARGPLTERKADRTIFHVQNSTAAVGSDAFELLKRAPGLQVQGSTVRMTGKSTVSVLLNDKLLQLSGEELEAMLRSIPSDQVDGIEVITTPPARYDAEGNSGIVHIVTKKNLRDGFTGQVTAGYQQRVYSANTGNASFNYRRGKLNVYGNGNLNSFHFFAPQETQTIYPLQQQDQYNNQNNFPLYSRNQLGIDIAASPKSTFGLLYTIGFTNRLMRQDFRTRVSAQPGNTTDSFLSTKTYTSEHALRNVLNLNYEWKIDTSGKKLNVDGDYFTRTNELARDFRTRNFYPDGLPTPFVSDDRSTGRLRMNIFSLKTDLTLPTKFINWSMGAKASWIHTNSDNRFYNWSGTDYLPDTGRSNRFDYLEQTQAVYLSAAKSRGKWEGQLGLRAEYTQTRGTLRNTGQVNTNDYLKLFPSFYLQYQVSDASNWTIRYSRRIERADFNDLNPFRQYSTATAYESGNPFLQPSFSHNAELAWTFLTDYSITVYVHQQQQCQVRLAQIDTLGNTYNFTMVNAGTGLSYGLTAAATVKPFPFWEISGSMDLFNTGFHADWNGRNYGNLNTTVFAAEVDNSFTCNRKQTLLAELGFSYTSDQQLDFATRQYAYGNVSAGFRVLMGQKRWTLAVNVYDIFRQDRWWVRNLYNGTLERSYFDSRMCSISLSRKLGKDSVKDRRNRNTESEEMRRAN